MTQNGQNKNKSTRHPRALSGVLTQCTTTAAARRSPPNLHSPPSLAPLSAPPLTSYRPPCPSSTVGHPSTHPRIAQLTPHSPPPHSRAPDQDAGRCCTKTSESPFCNWRDGQTDGAGRRSPRQRERGTVQHDSVHSPLLASVLGAPRRRVRQCSSAVPQD